MIILLQYSWMVVFILPPEVVINLKHPLPHFVSVFIIIIWEQFSKQNWNIKKYVLLCKSYFWRKKSLKIRFMVKFQYKNHNKDSFVWCHLLGSLTFFNMIPLPHAWQELVLLSHNDNFYTTYDLPGGHFFSSSISSG